MKHASDSTEQISAEQHLLGKLKDKINVSLESAKIKLPSGVVIQFDGYNEKEKILCEVYARIGALKGSQPDKVASDILKMLLVEKELNQKFEKHYCFSSEEAAKKLIGNSWLGATAKRFNVKIHVFELPIEMTETIKKAQERQKMINKN